MMPAAMPPRRKRLGRRTDRTSSDARSHVRRRHTGADAAPGLSITHGDLMVARGPSSATTTRAGGGPRPPTAAPLEPAVLWSFSTATRVPKPPAVDELSQVLSGDVCSRRNRHHEWAPARSRWLK
jgi:hypothetical protein